MYFCPKCNMELLSTRSQAGVFWACSACGGRSATLAVLRKTARRELVNGLWQDARQSGFPQKRKCPACKQMMSEVPVAGKHQFEFVDVCTNCQLIWFDRDEFDDIPEAASPKANDVSMPQEILEQLSLLEIKRIAAKAQEEQWNEGVPDEWWQYIPGILGLPVEIDGNPLARKPWATWLLAFLITLISAFAFFDLSRAVNGYGLVPDQMWRHGGVTFFTSFFLHASIFHLLSNMYFLLVFGDNVENFLGRRRFLLLVLLSTLAGHLLHIIGDPASEMPCVGASGGIAGIVAFYACKFSNVHLGIMLSYLLSFKWIRMAAWMMFLFWIGIQALGAVLQIDGRSNVSYLAHIGGAIVGVVFWLLTRNNAALIRDSSTSRADRGQPPPAPF